MVALVSQRRIKLVSHTGEIEIGGKWGMDREEYHELKLFIEREGNLQRLWPGDVRSEHDNVHDRTEESIR